MAETEPKKTPMYALTLATVIGVAGGSVGTAALTVKAGVEQPKQMEATKIVDTSVAKGMTLAQMAVAGCAIIDEKHDLSGSTACSIDDSMTLTAYVEFGPGKTKLKAEITKSGTWSAGGPE